MCILLDDPLGPRRFADSGVLAAVHASVCLEEGLKEADTEGSSDQWFGSRVPWQYGGPNDIERMARSRRGVVEGPRTCHSCPVGQQLDECEKCCAHASRRHRKPWPQR